MSREARNSTVRWPLGRRTGASGASDASGAVQRRWALVVAVSAAVAATAATSFIAMRNDAQVHAVMITDEAIPQDVIEGDQPRQAPDGIEHELTSCAVDGADDLRVSWTMDLAGNDVRSEYGYAIVSFEAAGGGLYVTDFLRYELPANGGTVVFDSRSLEAAPAGMVRDFVRYTRAELTGALDCGLHLVGFELGEPVAFPVSLLPLTLG